MKLIKVIEDYTSNKIKLWKLENYMNFIANQYGYKNYKDMKKDGLTIPIDDRDIIEIKGDD